MEMIIILQNAAKSLMSALTSRQDMPLLSNEKHKEEAKRTESTWEGIKTFIYAIGLALIFRSFFFEPFHIPSGSMRSNLLIGDYIFVSKYSYGYSNYSFPFSPNLFTGRIWETKPARGDIAVFRLPTNPKIDYIKRVVGLPGEVIKVHDGIVYVNDKPFDQERIDGDFVYYDEEGYSKQSRRYLETNFEGRQYEVLDHEKFGDVDFTAEFIVPEGHYFMMGDNRDRSQDSRYPNLVGMVPIENFIGRAEMILFSIDPQSEFEFWEFWKYPSMFRDGRSFEMID